MDPKAIPRVSIFLVKHEKKTWVPSLVENAVVWWRVRWKTNRRVWIRALAESWASHLPLTEYLSVHLRVELGIGKLSEMLGEEKRGLFNRLENPRRVAILLWSLHAPKSGITSDNYENQFVYWILCRPFCCNSSCKTNGCLKRHGPMLTLTGVFCSAGP